MGTASRFGMAALEVEVARSTSGSFGVYTFGGPEEGYQKQPVKGSRI